MPQRIINPDNIDKAREVFGENDSNISLIEDAFLVKIMLRPNEIIIGGDREENCVNAENVILKLFEMVEKGEVISRQMVGYFTDLAAEGNLQVVRQYSADVICMTSKGRQLKAKTAGQKEYINAIKQNTVTFGIGPAGTGKTYLAVAAAVTAFKNHEVSRIILTRPAVEAGEKLGFLPGDLQNKVDPYLRPLYDALYDIMGMESYMRNYERGAIEIAPLAYMRGRTLDDSFIILDEAQNTTYEQLKMLLTRIGQNSKAVVTGDITQIDLPADKKSGLKLVTNILKDIEGIAFVNLTEKDIVRHRLVQQIINAYAKYEAKRNGNKL